MEKHKAALAPEKSKLRQYNKNYRLQRLAQKTLGFSQKRVRLLNDICLSGQQKTAIERTVSFFLKDGVSLMTTGKQQTIT